MQFDEFRQSRERSTEAEEGNTHTAAIPSSEYQRQTRDEIMRMAHRQIETALGQDLLDRARAAPPAFFERLLVDLLLSMDYGAPAPTAPVELLGVLATMQSTELSIRTFLASTASTYRRSDMQLETIQAPARFAISSEALIGTERQRAPKEEFGPSDVKIIDYH